jgi:hypothetical protein
MCHMVIGECNLPALWKRYKYKLRKEAKKLLAHHAKTMIHHGGYALLRTF